MEDIIDFKEQNDSSDDDIYSGFLENPEIIQENPKQQIAESLPDDFLSCIDEVMLRNCIFLLTQGKTNYNDNPYLLGIFNRTYQIKMRFMDIYEYFNIVYDCGNEDYLYKFETSFSLIQSRQTSRERINEINSESFQEILKVFIHETKEEDIHAFCK